MFAFSDLSRFLVAWLYETFLLPKQWGGYPRFCC